MHHGDAVNREVEVLTHHKVMSGKTYQNLSKRERQIIDALHRIGEGSVSDVLALMPDPPGYNSVRVLLTVMEEKKLVNHRKDGKKYIYRPTMSTENAKRSALKNVMTNFFEGSAPSIVSTLLSMEASELSSNELDELQAMIERAKNEGTK